MDVVMDIERLKDATRRITRAMCSRSVNTAYHGFIEDLDELTHWAFQHIAAQSATIEDVAEAIEELMSGVWQSSKDGYPITLGGKTLDLAITALQAYQPWVMVSVEKPETYPPNGKVVLLKMSNAQYPVIGHYSKTFENFKTLTGGEYPVSIVTHYKSLPQPPKGE